MPEVIRLDEVSYMSKMKLEEPDFMNEIHKIRAKLAQIPYSKYEETVKKAKEKYRERLGHLYVDAKKNQS